MSFFLRLTESVPTPAAHLVGVGSGVTGLALWADLARHLTVFAGLVVVLLTILGGSFYAGYWALKMWAKWKRVQNGDYED